MKQTLLIYALAGALLASAALNLTLWRGHGDAAVPPPAGDRVASCIDELALTPDQLGAITTDCIPCCNERTVLQAEIEKRLHSLERALGAESIDRAAARKLAAEVASLHERWIANCVDSVLQLRSMLTPAQSVILSRYCTPKK